MFSVEGIFHKKWKDCWCETSTHSKGRFLSNDWNVKCAGEGAGGLKATHRLSNCLILFCINNSLCATNLLFFHSFSRISEAKTNS